MGTDTKMRKLKIFEHISLDGVIQHSADDDNFPYSDWTAPYRTPAGREAMLAANGESFDLLLGRRTYDIWSGFCRQGSAAGRCRIFSSGEHLMEPNPIERSMNSLLTRPCQPEYSLAGCPLKSSC